MSLKVSTISTASLVLQRYRMFLSSKLDCNVMDKHGAIQKKGRTCDKQL